MASALPLPVVVLGGSDRRITDLPEGGRDKHALGGFKGARVRWGGRALVQVIVERLSASGAFDPVLVVGPSAVYSDLLPPQALVDSDGTFAANVRAGLEAVLGRFPGRAVAFSTCDILPESQGIARLMERYAGEAPFDMWFPLVRVPAQPASLGASSWKPAYRLRPVPGSEAIPVLPGHLAIVDPLALRLEFVYRLLDLGYRTRNRSIDRRRGAMLRGVLADLFVHDVGRLVRLRAPTVTWSVLRAALPAARMLRDGAITLAELERALRTVFVRGRHMRQHPRRRVHLPIVDELFLARDIDTVEEALEIGASLGD